MNKSQKSQVDMNIFLNFRSKISDDSSNSMHDTVNAIHNCLFPRSHHSQGQHPFLK